ALLGHHRTARAEGVAKSDESKLAGAEENEVLGEPGEVYGHRGEGEQRLEHEVAITDGVDTVWRYRVESQFAGQLAPPHPERRTGDGTRPQRHDASGVTCRPKAVAVARNGPEMREQPVSGAHRLCTLQVRVCRHNGTRQTLRPTNKRSQEGIRLRQNPVNGVHRVEAGCRGNLVVAAPSRMKAGSDSSDLLVKQSINQRVNILVALPKPDTLFNASAHSVQTPTDARRFARRQNASWNKRPGPCLRQANVERPQPQVNVDGPVDGDERGVRGGDESATPKVVRTRSSTRPPSSRRRGDTHGVRPAPDAQASVGWCRSFFLPLPLSHRPPLPGPSRPEHARQVRTGG